MKKTLNKIIMLVFLVCLFMGAKNEIMATTLSSNELLKFRDYTITKTTKVDDVISAFGEPKEIGDSAFGGNFYSFCDDDYTWYLCLETNEIGTIMGYGCINGDFIAKNYTLGDIYTGVYSRLCGSVIYERSNDAILGIYEYNCGVSDATNYLNKFSQNSEYLYELQKHALIVSKILAKRHNYSFPQTYINEDLFYRNEQLKFNGTDLYKYSINTGKSQYISLIMSGRTDFYADLPNPIRLGKKTEYYTNAENYKYIFYDVNMVDSSAYSETFVFIDPSFLNERNNIELTPTELDLLEAVKVQYELYIEHGNAITSNFDINPVYTELPLVAGKWTDMALLMTTDYLNIARVGLGLGTLTLNPVIADCAQHKAALVYYMSYKGMSTGHMPEKPDGVSDEFYTKAQSYMNENLYHGNIQVSVVNALNDGYGDPVTCGHRYNLLEPSYTEWGVGSVGSGLSFGWQGVHKFYGYNDYSNELVAWPSNGIFPIDMAYNGIGNWTAQFYKNYKVLENSTVTVKNLSTNKTYDITENGTNKLLRVTGNSLITFRDDSITYESGDVFEITIHNVQNRATSEISDYTYRSVFMSLYDIGNIDTEDIELDVNNVALAIGRIKKVNATVMPENAGNKLMNIYSEDPNVATVRQDGLITGIGIGKTKIHFVCGNVDKILEVTVEEFQKGDMNTDGYINSTDAALVLDRFKNNDATIADYKLGDMNEDNMLNSTDAAMILDIFKNVT